MVPTLISEERFRTSRNDKVIMLMPPKPPTAGETQSLQRLRTGHNAGARLPRPSIGKEEFFKWKRPGKRSQNGRAQNVQLPAAGRVSV